MMVALIIIGILAMYYVAFLLHLDLKTIIEELRAARESADRDDHTAR